jgi:glycogen(starch) synthase
VATARAVTGVNESVLTSSLREVAERARAIAVVIPNGVVVGGDPDPPPSDPLVVLGVGRLVWAKGFDVLIQACAQYRPRARHVSLRIVGDGSERDSLRQLATDLGVEVVFTGALSAAEVAAEYDRASVVVMPSRREGQPLVAMEAAAAGRPVIGSRIPGLSAVVVNGVTGTLVPGDDPAALAAALGTLLDDPGQLARLGAAARRRAVDEYSVDRCVDRYLALYDAVLDRESSP